MQSERRKYSSKNPFKFLVTSKPLNIAKEAIGEKENTKLLPVEKEGRDSVNGTLVKSTFADRYESEIAGPSKMKEYLDISKVHKDMLLKESKVLREKFSEDMIEAERLEQSVTQISYLLSSFLDLLQPQSETVAVVHAAVKDAKEEILDVDKQLTVTLKRLQSNSTIIIILALTVFMWILDFITP